MGLGRLVPDPPAMPISNMSKSCKQAAGFHCKQDEACRSLVPVRSYIIAQHGAQTRDLHEHSVDRLWTRAEDPPLAEVSNGAA